MLAAPTVPEIAFEPARQQNAVHDGNHRPEMADHGQITFPGFAAVHVAVAAAHRSQRRAEIGAGGVPDGLAEGQPPRRIADQRREHVALLQRDAGRRAQGFLAASEEDAAVDSAGTPKRREFVIQQPRQQHEAVGDQIRFTEQSRVFRRARLEHRLQHGPILSPKLRASNVSFGIGIAVTKKTGWPKWPN